MLSDNGDPDFDVLALVPEWLRPTWEETVKQVMEDWNSWGDPVDPPPELLEYRRMADALDEPPREATIPGDRLVVDIPEAARMLSCGRTLIYDLIRTRQVLAAVEGSRLEAVVTLTLFTGLRQGEALGHRWPDLDLDGCTLRVGMALQRLRRGPRNPCPLVILDGASQSSSSRRRAGAGGRSTFRGLSPR